MKIYDIVLKIENSVFAIRGIKAHSTMDAVIIANTMRVKHGIMGYAYLIGWGETIEI